MVEIAIAIKTKIEINNQIWYFLTLLFFILVKFSIKHWKFQYSISKFTKSLMNIFKFDILHSLVFITQYNYMIQNLSKLNLLLYSVINAKLKFI